ncbi:hypothetical protein EPUL_003691 [Erysiphe pulchra]|uniref:Major facilitator superfamily (MFS) profile domain-containing protein n=1 Tax=Erysiphe pulchra TaxID=225359 RepID=A0A2S4PVS6_9PEZI|nr:hypothetical protein EPUL_003691 [Erysiphe pulchra]
MKSTLPTKTLSRNKAKTKDIILSVRKSWNDLFVWKYRNTVHDDLDQVEDIWVTPEPLKNPIILLGQLSIHNWLFFAVGFLAWTADAFDFHAITIQTTKLALVYKKSNTAITSAVTLTLLLRSFGAAIFGVLGDRFGRKWPMVINMFILGLLQIATIYCEKFPEFLGVRSLFGLFMGGIYGNAMAMALENCPLSARGLVSGILQQGYAFGYVLAACANLGVGGKPESTKIVFWIAAAFSILVGFLRILFPESQQFLASHAQRQKFFSSTGFWRDIKGILTTECMTCVYCTFLMSWFNFYSHTSQDSYTTFLKENKGLSNSAASRASIWMKVGACIGGTIMGYISQLFGRRRTIIFAVLTSALMIPGWILPNSEHSLSVTGFFMQFFVQGAWGVIPIHLNELAPTSFRASFTGITYQLGNLISSPSTQITNALSERFHVKSRGGSNVPAYGSVMAISTAIIVVGIVTTVAIGPEKRGRRFMPELLVETSSRDSKNNRGSNFTEEK